MDDEDLYLEASKEFEEGIVDDALWAKALTLSSGEETKAKYEYIKLKVEKNLNKNNSSKNFNYSNEKISIPNSVLMYLVVFIFFPVIPIFVHFIYSNVLLVLEGLFMPHYGFFNNKYFVARKIGGALGYSIGSTLIAIVVYYILMIIFIFTKKINYVMSFMWVLILSILQLIFLYVYLKIDQYIY